MVVSEYILAAVNQYRLLILFFSIYGFERNLRSDSGRIPHGDAHKFICHCISSFITTSLFCYVVMCLFLLFKLYFTCSNKSTTFYNVNNAYLSLFFLFNLLRILKKQWLRLDSQWLYPHLSASSNHDILT